MNCRRRLDHQLGDWNAEVPGGGSDVVHRQPALLGRRPVYLAELTQLGNRLAGQLLVHQRQLALAREGEGAVGQRASLARIELPVVVDVVWRRERLPRGLDVHVESPARSSGERMMVEWARCRIMQRAPGAERRAPPWGDGWRTASPSRYH